MTPRIRWILLLILALLCLVAGETKTLAPGDEWLMNEFAIQYNTYAERLRKDGHRDLKQWKRVVKAWDRLE